MDSEPILVVLDDDDAIGRLICDVAAGKGYRCQAFTSVKEFRAKLEPELAILFLDLMMPEEDGIEVLRYLASEKINANIILMSGFDKRVLKSASIMAQNLGLKIAYELTKPIAIKTLRDAIDSCSVESSSSSVGLPSFTLEELNLAIEEDRLFVQYQPKVELNGYRVFGAEALVRIRGRDGSIVPPGMFIQLAEESGAIVEITRSVVRQSIAFCSRLKGLGYEINISVNIPAQIFTDVRYTEELISEIHEAGIDPGDITIEITESALVKNYAISLDVLTRLRMKGVHLSIDDFGTGYSTLQQLKNVPFTELKLDRSFVVDIFDDDARTIIRKSIELSHGLGLKVLAEGVESREVAEQLAAKGCDYCQGYYFSRPIDADDFVDYLSANQHTL